MNGVTTQEPSIPRKPRRRSWYASGLAWRVLIAMIIGWLIVMAFFVTVAVSH